MNPLHHATAGAAEPHSSPSPRSRPGRRAALLLATALAATGLQAMADDGNPPMPAPWEPTVITALSDMPYTPDSGFNNGNYFIDEFSANPNGNNYFEGKKVARLSNGDIVVAALVKNPNANQTNGYWNIGLVRYNTAGQRVLWTNGGQYAHVNGEYIVYPKTNDSRFSWIQDIKVAGDKILVAANSSYTGGDVDTRIIVFGTDGSYKASANPFGSATATAEFVGGMDTWSYLVAVPGQPTTTVTQVVIVGTRAPSAGGLGRPLFRRYTLNADGSLSGGTGEVALNTHWCTTTSRDCRPAGITVAGVFNPNIYVVNRGIDTSYSPARECATVTRLDSNGVADSSWPSLYCDAYDDGSDTAIKYNRAQAIAVEPGATATQDHVFVLSEIQRQCRNGAQVTHFRGNYAAAGRTVFGGTPGLCPAVKTADFPVDMVLSGGKLAVVGFNQVQVLSFDPSYTGWVAFLDASLVTGVPLRGFTDYPMPNGADYRYTALRGIAPDLNGKFVVTGDGRFPNTPSVPESLRGKNAVATLVIAPDRIFGHGFE